MFIISNNILIFFYGVFMQIKYHGYLKSVQENYLLNSALVLAIHDFEDNKQTNINKELAFNKYNIGYSTNKIDDKKIYIKVFFKEKNRIKYREFLKQTSF
jgi:hypothetical protein